MQGVGRQPLRIGEFLIEPDRNRISNGSGAVALRPLVMDLLIYLAGRPGEVVGGDEIIDRVWRGVTVTSSSVYNCITELRQALGDAKADPAYIETIPKRGYRLIAAVSFPEYAKGSGRRADDNDKSDHKPGLAILTHALGKTSVLASLLAVTLLIAAYMVFSYPKGLTGRPSLAVLPFVNMSEEPGNEYFSDGITEEIIAALVQNRELDVIGRTSSFVFKDKPQDLRDIGVILGVGYIVEGSVRLVGDRVRVTAQLIEATNGVHLWSGTYDRQLSDILAVQDEIAQAVAGALQIELIKEDSRRLTGRGPTDPESYQAYLRGRYFWNRRTPEAELKAIEYFERAIEIAPDYAAAYHGLADAHLLLLVTGGDPLPYSDRFNLGLLANERALELDPGYGPAYATQALVDTIRFNLDEILPNSEKAIALAPNDPTTPHWMVMNLEFLGYSTNTLALMQQAVALDPLSVAINLSYGKTLFLAGQYEDAIAQYKETVTLAPGHEWALLALGMAYLELGRYEEARGLADTIDNAEAGATFRSWIDLIEGKTVLEEHDPRVDRLISEFGGRRSTTVALLVMAGFNNRATGYFEESAKAGLMLMLPIRIGSDPIIRRLFGEPRFRAFLRDMGFVDYWRKNGWPDNCAAADDMDGEADFRCGPL
ncbi:MAG: winged helix-turn-helix domain-containing protein [Proteobacteria bacterium]|nr:winged helix-turn-helix domain-containing protein [Pseudomonadota bacterium]